MIIEQGEEIAIPAGAVSAATAHKIRVVDGDRVTLVLQARAANAGTIFVGTKQNGAFMELPKGALFGRDIFAPQNSLYIYGTPGDLLYIAEGYDQK